MDCNNIAKYVVVYSYNEIPLSNKKGTNNLDVSQEHHTEWHKPDIRTE